VTPAAARGTTTTNMEIPTVSRTPHTPAVTLSFDPEALRPLIEQVVEQVLARVEAERARFPEGRLCYSEEEAAALLDLEPYVLAAERRR
jgi:hypothetical protein